MMYFMCWPHDGQENWIGTDGEKRAHAQGNDEQNDATRLDATYLGTGH